MPLNPSSRVIIGPIQYASVSTNTSCRSGNRSNTPPTMSCHSERPEKNECSIASVMIDAKPGGLYAGAPLPPCWLIGKPMSWHAAHTGSSAGSKKKMPPGLSGGIMTPPRPCSLAQ